MIILDIVQLISAVSTAICAFFFTWVSFVLRSNTGARWLAAGLSINLFFYIANQLPFHTIISVEHADLLTLASECLLVTCLYIGTRLFTDQTAHSSLLSAFSLFYALMLLVAEHIQSQVALVPLLVAMYCCPFLVATGLTLVRHKAPFCPWLWKSVGIPFIIWGLHWVTYPLLLHHDSLFIGGFYLAITLSTMSFTGYVVLMLQSLVHRAVIAEQQAVELSLTDELTGLGNRRYLEIAFRDFKNYASRHDHMMLLLFIDLDKFKHINDTHGHKAGDEALRHTAARLQKKLRESDMIFRIGGDEFIVLIPEIPSRDAIPILSREMANALHPPFLFEGIKLNVCASIGTAVFPADGTTLEKLLNTADRAMYENKTERPESNESAPCYE
ncbi:GGDEF domain-containing protein [Desulfovibrio mangrovi]|uniref:GGDEF domain-containing protein n=1 Tax=Desulfovibrio mangrovi TaxID=2976983 RepID=UPI002245DDE7|nr:GGDEF domain-containing protein [Desulfovibrio mangrovi]UZP67008.1 GGDEF domain-containing protein [Desulfovibrio mangrovi]